MQINRKVRPEILDSVALLVLDAQDAFIETIHNKDAFLKRVAFTIEAARCLGIHTIFTEQAPEKLGRANSTLYKLAQNPKVFAKRSFSALGAPGIERYLRDKEIYHLLVVGLEVPICVYQTGLQATDEDVDMTILSDAISSRRADDEAPVLNALARLGCQVLPSEAVFYSLLADTQSPYFRAFNQLVKTFGDPDFNLDSYLANRANTPAPPEEKEEREEARPQRQRDDQAGSATGGQGDDSDKRRSRGRGRRRRGRGREGFDPQPRPGGANQGEQQDHKQQRPRDNDSQKSEPRKEEPIKFQPERPAPSREQPPHAVPEKAIDAPKGEPVKKAAKKAAKKVAKKAAKKAAKKVARKRPAKKPENPGDTQ